MAAAKPWLKFYPRDWRADEKLRDCSLAARGLWIEMIAIMHSSDKYGRLLIAGKAPTAVSLARQVGASETEVEAMLAELESADVFSRDVVGIIYSRRMKSDEKVAENARKYGKQGGNPKLSKQTENSDVDKGQDKVGDKASLKPRGQRPDKKPIVKKEISIPDDWQPLQFGEATKCRAIVDGWSTDQRETQTEKFTAHHRGHGNQWADWQSAWQTWVLNSVQFAAPRFGQPTEPKPLHIVIAERTAMEAGVAR